MFERPNKDDLDRALSELAHHAHHNLLARRNEIRADAIKAGALHNSRLVIVIASAADEIHAEAVQNATLTLREFVRRMETPPAQITEWARPHLEGLSNTLLSLIPSTEFPDVHKRVFGQFQSQFSQRTAGAMRDVEIGFLRGEGFAGTLDQTEWLRAAEAVEMLKPILPAGSARLRICERAYEGLIRARAQHYRHGERKFADCEIPTEFWWAKGRAALEQDWAAGDFSTWLDKRVELKAFGVSFARADLQKLLPSSPTKATAGAEKIVGQMRVIVFTDLVEHTNMMSRLGDEKGRTVVREHERVTRDALAAHGGQEVKTLGDGFMASFVSVTQAVKYAIDLQYKIEALSNEVGEPIAVRVGLSAGEPIAEIDAEGRTDLFGGVVILAARIANAAKAGEILVSDAVRGLCTGKDFRFADRGKNPLKGFTEHIQIFEVIWR